MKTTAGSAWYSDLAGFPAMSRGTGRWIGFQLKRGGEVHVAYMPAGGGAVIQPTNEASQAGRGLGAGQRTPDLHGTAKCYLEYLFRFASDRQGRATHEFHQLDSYVRYPACLPLGDEIAFEYAESNGNIWN